MKRYFTALVIRETHIKTVKYYFGGKIFGEILKRAVIFSVDRRWGIDIAIHCCEKCELLQFGGK